MAKLSDVDYSRNGETTISRQRPPKEKVKGLVTYPIGTDGKPVYPTGKEFYMFKLVDNTKQGGVYIPNIDDVINPETGKVERARLLSGVSSIWVKDQKDVTAEFIKQNGRSISFPRGHKILRVSEHDDTMLFYCRVTNSNIGNPKRVKNSRFEFFEYDSAIAEQEDFEKEDFELEMALLAKQEKTGVMKKHAAFLGINMINDIGEPKSDEGIRREYVIYAKRNPAYFKQTMNTPQIEVSWMVKKAIGDSLIEIGREPGKVFWANGGGMICAIPKGVNPQNYLTDLAMTSNDEGQKFKEQLKQVVV